MIKKLGILLFISLLLCITGCEKKEECETKSTEQIMLLKADATIKFIFQESYDSCKKDEKEYTKNETTKVTNFELMNETAKNKFVSIDFKGLSLEEALKKYEEIIKEHDIKIDTIELYTTSQKDYSNNMSYDVNQEKKSSDEIDQILQKQMVLHQEFRFKVVVGMEYYYAYYEFISDKEVKYHTQYLCYGECDENETLKYTSSYDMEKDQMLLKLENDVEFIYDFKTGKLKTGDFMSE